MARGVPSAQSVAFAELLLDSGLITHDQLDLARAAKERTGSHIDEVLISLGMISTDELRSLMARTWGLPVVDLATTDRDEALIRRWSGQMMLAENWMPLRRDAQGVILVATARVPDQERRWHIESVLGEGARFVVATSWDIRNLLLTVFRKAIADEAANELFRQNPALSARVVFSRGQKSYFG